MPQTSFIKRFFATAFFVAFFATTSAWATDLVEVTDFGSNPGTLKMHKYVPEGLPAGSPLIVILHGCTESPEDYHVRGGWNKMADTYKLALVYPETSESNNPGKCFNWFQTGHQVRDKGEALSIKQMVDTMTSAHGIDPKQVYITGISGGGAMASVMLANYPEMFAGGSIFSGIAYGCASEVMGGFKCINQSRGFTPQQWGDAVRNANPDYKGPWPIVAVWHGTFDTNVNMVNTDQIRDQWTNVHGISQKPTSKRKIKNVDVENYDKNKRTVVSVFRVDGMGHGLPVDPGEAVNQCGKIGPYYRAHVCSSYYSVVFWGLDARAKKPGKAQPVTAPAKKS